MGEPVKTQPTKSGSTSSARSLVGKVQLNSGRQKKVQTGAGLKTGRLHS